MKKEEFLQRLAFLLQDLPEDEQQEALEYYEAYFEDAGPENEASVIKELESPEKVAAMIRDSVKGTKNQDEYTEHGYYNRRYDDKNRMPGKYGKEKDKKETWHLKGNRDRNIALLIIIGVLAAGSLLPAVFGIIFGIGGGVIGIAGGIFSIFIGITGSCIGLILGGVGLSAAGIFRMISNLPTGLMMLGKGFWMITLGLALCLLIIWVITKILPGMVEWIVNFFRKLFHKGGARR
jgi:uncharacterized membrane protein